MGGSRSRGVAPEYHRRKEEEWRHIAQGKGPRYQGIEDNAQDWDVLDYYRGDGKLKQTWEQECVGY